MQGVEIPCPTCLTWSHLIQDKSEIYIYLSLDKYKGSQYNFAFHNYELNCCMENSVDPDQLQKPADLDLHCLLGIL